MENHMGDFDSAHDRLLAREDVPRDINTPIEGCYRVKSRRPGGKADVFVPVRYQYVGDFGQLECYIDGRKVDEQRAIEQWPWASANPVTEEAYRNALNGHPWPDVDATVHAVANGAGSNNPPSGEELPPEAQLAAKVRQALTGLTTYVKWHVGDPKAENNPATLISATQDKKVAYLIGDDEVRDRAQSLRDLLLKLKGDAEKAHKVEKAPHLEAGRAIDRKWFDIRDMAEAGANALRAAMSAWETKKLQRHLAESAKAQEAELAQRVESAKKEAVATGQPVVVVTAPPPPPPPAPASRIKGGTGKATSSKVVTQVDVVTDWKVLAAHYVDIPQVRDMLLKLANDELKDGRQVPGVTTHQVAEVR
jgi:hypothetical protein